MSRRMRNYRVMAEEFYLQGKSLKALEMYRKAMRYSRSREDTSLLLFNIGVILTELGKLDGAIRCYKKIIEINPIYVDAYYQLGVISEDKGEYEEAVELYKSALRIDSKDTLSMYNLANLYDLKGEEGRARNLYKRILKLEPEIGRA